MFKMILFSILFFLPSLLFAESSFQPGDPVYAEWKNGSFYKATVKSVAEGKVEIQWQDGSAITTLDQTKVRPRKDHGLDKSQIADWDATDEGKSISDVVTLWEVLPLSDKKAGKEVYAMYQNGLYYKAFVLESKEKNTRVRWADNSGEMWTDSVKPRKGHGLKASLIGDRELTKAELKEKQKAKEEDTSKYEISCSKLRTRMDCLRTYDPCGWNDRTGCSYRGY